MTSAGADGDRTSGRILPVTSVRGDGDRASSTPPPEPRPVRSVYVHAPFCAHRCFYCDFPVEARRDADVDGWIAALSGELEALEREGLFPLADRLDTLYVGGGTPSLLGPGAMARLVEVLGSSRLGARGRTSVGDGPESDEREAGGADPTSEGTDADLEWTVEANPEDFTTDLAARWRAAGMNRVSLGVQSFRKEVLGWLGRLHDPEQAVRAVETARNVGFREINLDLLFGLPPHLGRAWEDDLDRAVALDVSHLSLYGLTAEDGTELGRAVASGQARLADEDVYRERYLRASERLSGEGYVHYEVSNFARPGSLSRHNLAYWSGAPYLGLGNGAHSYRDPFRRWNLREWDAYREKARRSELPEGGRETLDRDARRIERIWLGLRTRRGLAVAGLDESARVCVDRWTRDGLARVDEVDDVDEEVLRLTPTGWLDLDRLAVELDRALGPASPELDAASVADRSSDPGEAGRPLQPPRPWRRRQGRRKSRPPSRS